MPSYKVRVRSRNGKEDVLTVFAASSGDAEREVRKTMLQSSEILDVAASYSSEDTKVLPRERK